MDEQRYPAKGAAARQLLAQALMDRYGRQVRVVSVDDDFSIKDADQLESMVMAYERPLRG